MRMKICTFVETPSFYDDIDVILQERYTSRRLHSGRPTERLIIQLERDIDNSASVLTSHRKVSFYAQETDTTILFLNNQDFLLWIDSDAKNNIIRRN